jgi:Flp pilus assembly protein protease CpaA
MDLFLIILAGIWLVIASLQDIKKREVPNWLNFSLIIFALGYRAIYASINSDLMFFV